MASYEALIRMRADTSEVKSAKRDLDNLTGSSRETKRQIEQTEAAVDKTGRTMTEFTGKTNQTTQAVKQNDSAFDALGLSAASASAQINRSATSFGRIGRNMSDLSSSARAASAGMEQAGQNVIQAGSRFGAAKNATSQLSFQLQDVAVQAQAGTDAMIILGQQGPQIASIFGPGGAVVGSLLAFGALIVGVAMKMGATEKSAEELRNEIEDLGEEFRNLTAAQQAFVASQRVDRIKEMEGQLRVLENELARTEISLTGAAGGMAMMAGGISAVSDADPEALAAQIDTLKRAIQEEKDALDGRSVSAQQMIEDLQGQLELVGLSAKAEALHTAAINGATEAQLRQIANLYDLIAAREHAIEVEENYQNMRARVSEDADAQYERERAAAVRAGEAIAAQRQREIDADIAETARKEAEKTRIAEVEAAKRAATEQRLAAENTARLLEFSDMLLEGKSDKAKAATALAINLADAEKRENAKQIISDSYSAAMKAYKSLSGIPVIGPALGAAAAGAIIAAGVTYSAKSLTGRALGGQVRPGESYVVGERGPEVLTMGNAGGRIATNESMRGAQPSLVYSPTVNISGGATEQDRALFTAQLRQQKAEIADLLARRRF